MSSKITTAATSTTVANKKARTGLSMKDTVYFDPTSIGLPENWSLTDWSDLKGTLSLDY